MSFENRKIDNIAIYKSRFNNSLRSIYRNSSYHNLNIAKYYKKYNIKIDSLANINIFNTIDNISLKYKKFYNIIKKTDFSKSSATIYDLANDYDDNYYHDDDDIELDYEDEYYE